MDDAELYVRVPGEGGCVLLRGAVVRTGQAFRWALGMSADTLREAIKERGWAATQRRAPAFLVLDEKDGISERLHG